ncbi:MAG: glycerate kinase [Phycisphaerales bacterium]|nr:glycerate kinase [Phycisphaerales bacterium]
MRIVIAPDKFKGCLSADEVAEAVARGVRLACPDARMDLCPMADGGEGIVSAMVRATGGKSVNRIVTGPLVGMKVEAPIGFLGDGSTAVIEMSAASGLALLPAEQRNPFRTTTYGTGELIRHAVQMGAKRIILGIGGRATVDGGIGCAQACGATIVFENGTPYSSGGRRLTGADVANVLKVQPVKAPPEKPGEEKGIVRRKAAIAAAPPSEFAHVEFVVACDVGNPLFGPEGAAPIFGPQKGATPEQVEYLDAALHKLAQRSGRLDLATAPGAGAAGGLGFGMMAFFGATLRSGIDIVMEATRLRKRLEGADLCLTGEGRLDSQSAAGKTAVGVARLCKEMQIPCIAIAGSIGIGAEVVHDEGINAYFSICDGPMTLEDAMKNAATLLERAASNVIRLYQSAR